MATIFVKDRVGVDHTIQIDSGTLLMDPLREIDDGVEALCGGMCSCSTCHVYVDSDWVAKLPERQDDELELLEDTECFGGEKSRLACQITMNDELDGMHLTVAPEE
jgi:2Fe-2S ferredoxin